MSGKDKITSLLKQADEILREARNLAFEYGGTDGISKNADIDIQEIRDAIASVLNNDM